ncbi:ROK family protein [Flavihumibacter petaseus]|uniref:Glucokinase n=1 Tax=Flavihumibacter petaseus NBRC 106054 TaxID=1220578 RepID=A0A0E9N010_9BACT|nr:ROK family protein [Flavihumibacter petaseus]GAO42715.1 hypothetical protein FPE01S_01_17310 [Flavihumibacter petaseus NBRC 106054]
MIIGVDLGGTNARAGLVDNGRILQTEQAVLSNKTSLDDTLEQLFSVIEPLSRHDIEGIGIGVPSVVDVERGIVYDVVNIPSWKKVELKKILEDRFGRPVYVNNDVNCLAMGEKMFGQAAPFKSFVTIGIGTGLGAAIVIDNKLHSGLYCGAGEIGYIPYLDKNLEYYGSGMYFEGPGTSAHQAYLSAVNGDAAALEQWASYGRHLGEVMKIVLYTYAPEAIIIGGGLSNAFRFFENAMYDSMKDFLFQSTLSEVKILCSSLENIAIVGAAALVGSNK